MDSRDVETYWEQGVWRNRRIGSEQPFSSGGPRLRQLTIGAEVARWAGVRHIIKDPDGQIVETNVYAAGPYPSRSPVEKIHYTGSNQDHGQPTPA